MIGESVDGFGQLDIVIDEIDGQRVLLVDECMREDRVALLVHAAIRSAALHEVLAADLCAELSSVEHGSATETIGNVHIHEACSSTLPLVDERLSARGRESGRCS